MHAIANNKSLAALPPEYRAALEAAFEEANAYMLARYDSTNPQAIKRLVGSGAVLEPFPKPVLDACYKATQEVYAEAREKYPEFRKLRDHYFGVQKDMISWFRVTGNTFDDYMAGVRR